MTDIEKLLKKYEQDYTEPEEDKEIIQKLTKRKKKPYPEKKLWKIKDDLTRLPTPFRKNQIDKMEPLLIEIFLENALPIDYRRYKRFLKRRKKVSDRETLRLEKKFPETLHWKKARKRFQYYGEETN